MSVVTSKSPAAPVTLKSVGRGYFDRIRGGDLGALPAVLGLLVLCTAFSIMRPVFLSALNFANLLTQGAALTVIAMGLIFVLLLGEIDLSAGYASGVCAAMLAVLLTQHGWPWYAAVLASLLTGAAIGLALGVLVAKLGIPSFVVTLAAFLAFQGVVLLMLKEGTNISIQDSTILAISNNNMTPTLSWAALALDLAGQQQAALAALDGRPMALPTARAESTAELLCAELSADGLPVDLAIAERILASFIGPRPRSEADAAAQRAERGHDLDSVLA